MRSLWKSEIQPRQLCSLSAIFTSLMRQQKKAFVQLESNISALDAWEKFHMETALIAIFIFSCRQSAKTFSLIFRSFIAKQVERLMEINECFL